MTDQRIVVAGSRDFKDLNRVRRYVDNLPADTFVITGGARGVDKAAELVAHDRDYLVSVVVPADWDRHGKRAGYLRNREMIRDHNPDLVVAFWDGESPGTKQAIDLALRYKVDLEVHFE